MAENTKQISCRKCGAPNPLTNEYCQSCGAVLQVSTSMMNAQPKAVVPIIHRFKMRWVFTGLFVMLGSSTIAIILSAIIGLFVFEAAFSGDMDFGNSNSIAPGLLAVTSGIFLLAFVIGGALISWMSNDKRILESMLSALIVILTVGAAGQALSTDAFGASVFLALPCAGCAAIGAWLGKFTGGNKP